MTTSEEQLSGHEGFSELCALAMSGTLTVHESAQLKGHLQTCLVCRKAYREYVVLTREGIPHLASRYSSPQEQKNWDDTEVRRKLFARVRAVQTPTLLEQLTHLPIRASRLLVHRRIASDPFVAMAIAACVVLAVSVGAFWYGQRIEAAARLAVASVTVSADDRVQMLTSEKQAVDNLLGAQSQKLGLLQVESSEKQKKIEKLHSELTALQEHANELEASNASSVEELRSIAQQREVLTAQLQEARQAYAAVQAELVALRTDRDKTSLRLASLEVQVSKLSTTNRDLQSKLESTSQFLSSDRDIRELMGARNLYIADVFDVDSGSRTRKPFGRIFYTQGKLLIFYAFDLDRQPGLRNTSAFQAWGQRETPKGETAQPVNLGILYMDNETNRRWALRCDDPQELAEIDAVFVTVEPHGGSQKPTGEPLLYAMLRKEANHP
jgi:predicted  nucleic acid-binding Zn-ribbon protein